jgi:hypothetical protein
VLQAALDGLERVIGAGSREYQGRAAHFGEMVFDSGYQADGMAQYRRVLDQRLQHFGEGDPWTIGFLIQISHSAGIAEGWDVQRRYLEQGLGYARKHLPMGNETRSHMIGTVAWWYRRYELPQALELYKEFLANVRAENPERPEEIQAALDAIAALSSEQQEDPEQRPAEAAPSARQGGWH